MTLHVLVACDSNPAPYAGGQDWPCRAWRTTAGDSSLRANHEATRDGWTVELVTLPDGSHTYRHTCPACVRAAAALGQTR